MPHAPFVTTAWLADRLDAPDVVVVDGSWYLPTMNRDPQADYLAGHIPVRPLRHRSGAGPELVAPPHAALPRAIRR